MDTQFGGGQGAKQLRLAEGTGRHASTVLEDLDGPEENDLAHIVHDLKSPLSTIALEVDLLEERNLDASRLDISQSIQRIRRNVHYLDRLIYDLLDACTLSGGQLQLNRSRCELGGLLASVIERLVPTKDRHRVTLEAPEETVVVIDAIRIERVIANMLDNALKYTPSSGGIIVRLTKEQYSAQISIADAGPGLSPAEIEIVFRPYRRAASAHARPGSGLGLYVSKQIVEAHGGLIGVESVRGMGARFFFALPLAT
jgi:signal transduction histidine kinase